MSWNFDYIIPTFVVLVFFLIFYFLKPVYLTRSNRCFLLLVVTEIVGFILESYTCYVDSNFNFYSKTFIILINNISLITFLSRYFLISVYLSCVLHVNIKKDILSCVMAVIYAAIVVVILTNPWTNLLYSLTPGGNYFRATYYFIYYIACIIPLVVGLYYLLRFGRKLEITEIIPIVLTIVTLCISCVLKVLYQRYLITDAFFVFVIMGLFFIFENPAILIDKRTGLLNFSAFNEIISEDLMTNKNFSMLLFTIKNYNEKRQIYGALQAEMALKEIGKFFLSLSHIRKCFYLRNGSFVIVEKNNKNFDYFKEVVTNRFELPWIINNASISVDIITINTADDVTFTDLDEISSSFGLAFAEAKKKGVKSITITKDSLVQSSRMAKISIALNKALLEDELQVYFQPIVDASTRKIVAAEALVRIHDDNLGVIPPVEFITMAERNGSIEQLGEQVLNKVCLFLNKTEIYNKGIQWINVNLSPIQCQNKSLPQKIDNITNSNTIDHKYIHLEITEESIIDTEVLKNQMNVLIVAGYKFSLDDFGSGFANVTRVKMFPFNNVKLDMGIVREHFKHPDDILPSVVKSFNKRGLSVTAEGVETKEMADMLEEMGCKYLQGYYFSKPVPGDEFLKLLND